MFIIIVSLIFSFFCGYLLRAIISGHLKKGGNDDSADAAGQVERHIIDDSEKNRLLLGLLGKGDLFNQDLTRALKSITEAGSKIFDCGRVSVWFYNDDFTILHCMDLYTSDKNEHRSGEELRSSDFPSYVNAHISDIIISASDVFTDPRTRDIPEQYFRENRIVSLLDTTIWSRNRLYGVFSLEHTGERRIWSRDDERFSMILANMVSLCVEADRRKFTEKELKKAELQLINAGDNLSGGMIYRVIVQRDGTRKFTFVSAGVKMLHALSPEEIMEDPGILYAQIHEDDVEIMKQREEYSLENISPFDIEVRFRTPHSGIRWSRIFSHPTLMRNGDVAFDGLEIDITDRKINETLLSESEKKFRMLYENMRDGIVEVSLEGKILDFNDAYLAITGYTREELININYRDITPDKWHETEKKLIQDQVLKRGYSDVYEKEYIKKDGSIIPIDLRAYYIPGNRKDQGRMWGIIRDISERKRNEALLIEKEESLRITLDSIGDAVISTDMKGNIVRMNPAAARLTGWNAADAQGRDINEVFRIKDPANYRREINPVEEVLQTGEVVFLEEDTILLSRDGSESRIMDSAAPIINDYGETAGVVLVFRDVTEQFRLERESLQNALIFRTIFETSPFSIVIQSAKDSRYVMVNPAFLAASGLKKEDIIGKTMAEIGRKVDSEDERRAVELLQSTGKIDNMLIKSTGINGGDTYTLFSSRIIEFNGEASILSVTIDITETKRIQEQLNHIQKMDAIGQLAGGIAHDFNNMLGGIMGAAELLQNRVGSDEKIKKYIQMITSTAERAASLTGKLLAFSRKSAIEEMPVDLHKVIRDAAELLGRTIDKKININLFLNAEQYTVSGDISQLMSVFINLGINAVHAMPDGGELAFRTRIVYLDEHYCRINAPDLIPGSFLVIEIQDTGCGIPQENLGRIFEPFFTTKEKGKGTGMGLASVYGSIRQHHGLISVYSEQDQGTVFHVYLPIAECMLDEQVSVKEFIHGTGCILVVDDEEIMRITAEELLKYLGYDVLLAADGKEGADIFAKEHDNIDLVMLDMVMPVMNGRECFRELKKIDPEVKVVISSGFALDDSLNEMRASGLAGFIKKPFQTADLSRMISGVIADKDEKSRVCHD